MDILARLRRLKTSLADMASDFNSSRRMKSPSELMPEPEEEELPLTPPSEGEAPNPEDVNLGDEDLAVTDEDIPKIDTPEAPPVPDVPEETDEMPEEPPAEEAETSDVADIPETPEETNEDTTEEEEKPKERNWEPITPPDNDMKSLSFKSNKEKIFLDMKRLDVADGLWIARLYKDGKILDYGQIAIPKKVNDPITYIMELANAMLDSRSMRYEQEWRSFYDSKRKAVEEPPAEPEVQEAPKETPPEEESTEEKENEGMINTLFDQETVTKPGEEPEEEIDIGSLLD